jgi:hypothetical protein
VVRPTRAGRLDRRRPDRPPSRNLEATANRQAERGKPPKFDASQPVFAKAFKALVKDQSVPENIPYAVTWENLDKKMNVPNAVKSLRGKLNVPRERFRTNADGLYIVAGL